MKRPIFTPEELATFDSEVDAQRRRDMEIRWDGFSIAHLPRIDGNKIPKAEKEAAEE